MRAWSLFRLDRLLRRKERVENLIDRLDVKILKLRRRLGIAPPQPEKTAVLEQMSSGGWDDDSTRALR